MNTGCEQCAWTGIYVRTKDEDGLDIDIPCPNCTPEARAARADQGARHLTLTDEKNTTRNLCDVFVNEIVGVPTEPEPRTDGDCRWCHAYVDHITSTYQAWAKETA